MWDRDPAGGACFVLRSVAFSIELGHSTARLRQGYGGHSRSAGSGWVSKKESEHRSGFWVRFLLVAAGARLVRESTARIGCATQTEAGEIADLKFEISKGRQRHNDDEALRQSRQSRSGRDPFGNLRAGLRHAELMREGIHRRGRTATPRPRRFDRGANSALSSGQVIGCATANRSLAKKRGKARDQLEVNYSFSTHKFN
jgi:hypothetical protein